MIFQEIKEYILLYMHKFAIGVPALL